MGESGPLYLPRQLAGRKIGKIMEEVRIQWNSGFATDARSGLILQVGYKKAFLGEHFAAVNKRKK